MELAADTRIALDTNVDIRSSALLGQFQASRLTSPEFWTDPLHNEHMVESHRPYLDCQRFYFKDRLDEVQVPFLDEEEAGIELATLLKDEGQKYEALKKMITSSQRSLVGRLQNAGMLVIGQPA